MRRGLSVVQGGVGVGKTTVSRRLIQIFEDESDTYDFYLILDPKFETELFLLQHLIELFGINNKKETVQDCRDILESHLLKVGVDQGKVLVLIVDEGQNLDSKYLDVFRTLLNFETDDYKLLQLIIFGQPEMETTIQEYPNFEDRISFHFKIGPLDIDQMRGFIYHRLKMTNAPENNWFPDDVIQLIYNHTNGYPRKITKLCHNLLLFMIGEKKEFVDAGIFQHVIDGKPPKGLLKAYKTSTSSASANKLLDVLRKNKVTQTKNDPVEIIEEGDDDFIGGINVVEAIENDTTDDVVQADLIELEPDIVSNLDDTQDDKIIAKPIQASPSDTPKEYQAVSATLDNPGQYPESILLPMIFRDETVMGIAVDGNKIGIVSLRDHRKTKKLIDALLYEHPENIDFSQEPEESLKALKKAMEIFGNSVASKDFLTKKTIETIANGTVIGLSINSNLMQLKKIDIPKNGQNDRKNIIAWNAKKKLSFDLADLYYNSVNQGKNKESILLGTTNRQSLDQSSEVLTGQDWGIRWWHPLPMAIHNAFIWNYSVESKEICYVLHIGETESYILGYSSGLLQVIRPIAIGIQNLKDAVSDKSISLEDFRVPATLLPGKAKPGSSMPMDDQFRPIIESWTRELDRTLTSLKRAFPVVKATHLYLSGTSIYIKSLDEYFGGHLNLETTYINPLRNINILPDESERDQINIPMPLLTAAVGSALNLSNTVNLLPSSFKQTELFRFMLKIGIPVAAAFLVGLFSFTGWISFQNDNFNAGLDSLKKETARLEPTKDLFYSINNNKVSIKAQVDELSFDTEYFERILASLRFLSHYTPNEITFDEIRFQMGWEESQLYAYGATQKAELKVTDPHLRILKLSGTVSANSAYKDRILQIYLNDLEETLLFSKIEVVSKHTEIGLDVQEMSFVLKCIL